jgi:shikimate kinase
MPHLKGEGLAYGAVSLVNALATGKGATISVDLKTVARVELVQGDSWWKVNINKRPAQSPLAVETVHGALRLVGEDPDEWGGRIDITSDIPVAKGLKGSSSSSVAICLATLSAKGVKKFEVHDVLGCSVEASLVSGASLTGALDDAASCLLGGINHVDNLRRIVLSSRHVEDRKAVIIKVPRMRNRRKFLDGELTKSLSVLASRSFDMSYRGDFWQAMTLNGLIFSSLLGYDTRPALQALKHGALGAGLSGTGPSVAAIFDVDKLDRARELKTDWGADGSTVIETRTNNEEGKMVAIE